MGRGLPQSTHVLVPASAQPDASWTFAPGVLLALALALALYVSRWRAGRRDRRGPAVGRAGFGRLIAFCAGLLVVLVALVSPVDSLADQILAMHMVQHMLLLDIAPILILLGLTRVLLRPLTRRVQALERRAGFLAHPATAAVLYVGVMWAWHVPALYDVAAAHSGVHVLEHLSFSFVGGLYWWHILSPIPSRHRLTGLGPVAYMVGTKIGIGLLGIALTFAPNAIYPFYAGQPHYWGLSPHDDQSVAGLIMATEQSIVMGVVLAWLFARMLGEADRRDERAERYAV